MFDPLVSPFSAFLFLLFFLSWPQKVDFSLDEKGVPFVGPLTKKSSPNHTLQACWHAKRTFKLRSRQIPKKLMTYTWSLHDPQIMVDHDPFLGNDPFKGHGDSYSKSHTWKPGNLSPGGGRGARSGVDGALGGEFVDDLGLPDQRRKPFLNFFCLFGVSIIGRLRPAKSGGEKKALLAEGLGSSRDYMTSGNRLPAK